MDPADKSAASELAFPPRGARGRLGRRGFLGAMAWAAAALGLGSLGRLGGRWARGGLAWDVLRGFPDRPVIVRIWAPWLADGARVALTVEITTPREVIRRPAGDVIVHGGQGQATVALAYPYPGRVDGTYSYKVQARAGHARLATAQLATYSVRRVVWFS